ncbi:MAG: type II secretion system protein [Myxococcales bacterium]|nr:type II secretion system protein [Myxococcales bacterium]MCB9630175.1 type II secretion system protein [Sandaracinaceae bacterium]
MRRARYTRSPGGFTLVEVMMAISVMTVGAVAIFSMQSISVEGARRSREVTTATEVNRYWIERVKLEATLWGPTSFTLIDWLNAIPAANGASSDWFLPTARGTGDSLVTAASDWYGAPIAIPSGSGAAPAPYCTSLRWTRMATGTDEVARLDVRTWWHRPNRATGVTIQGCGADQVAVTTAINNIVDFGVVYSSTVIRWQGVPQ